MEFKDEQLKVIGDYANVLNTSVDDIKNQLTKAAAPEYLPLNLQFFGGDGGEGDPKEGTPEGTPEKVELTQEELNKQIEAESDRKLAKALEKKQKEWEEKQNEAIKKALEEKERLSKLSEKERQEEELTQREKDLERRLAEIERKELLADATADLTKKELPAEFAEILLGKDAESTLKNINEFKTTFDAAVNAKVKEALRQDTPPAGGGGVITKNPFSKEHWNLTEQGKLLKDNPELFKQLEAQAKKQ